MDINNVIVYNKLTGDLVPYFVKDGEIYLNASNVEIDNCIVTVWDNLRELNRKYGFVKENNIGKEIV